MCARKQYLQFWIFHEKRSTRAEEQLPTAIFLSTLFRFFRNGKQQHKLWDAINWLIWFVGKYLQKVSNFLAVSVRARASEWASDCVCVFANATVTTYRRADYFGSTRCCCYLYWFTVAAFVDVAFVTDVCFAVVVVVCAKHARFTYLPCETNSKKTKEERLIIRIRVFFFSFFFFWIGEWFSLEHHLYDGLCAPPLDANCHQCSLTISFKLSFGHTEADFLSHFISSRFSWVLFFSVAFLKLWPLRLIYFSDWWSASVSANPIAHHQINTKQLQTNSDIFTEK